MDQSLYANSIVTKISKKGVVITPRNTPLSMDLTMTKKDFPTTDGMQDKVNNRYPEIHFRSGIGSLIYLSSGTRPDITYAVGKLAKFSHAPGDNHYKALTWLLGYIYKYPNKAIQYYTIPNNLLLHNTLKEAKIELNDKLTVTFTDASWQDCVDTGQITGGYVTFKSGGVVNHRSYLPVPVALSSREAEYLAAYVACTAAQHIRMLNYNLYHLMEENYELEKTQTYPSSNVILDSKAAIAIAKSDKDTMRTRHILCRYHFV